MGELLKIVLLYSLLTNIGCAELKQGFYVQSNFEQIFNDYMSDAYSFNIAPKTANLRIFFDSSNYLANSNVLAVCVTKFSTSFSIIGGVKKILNKDVIVKKSVWDVSSDIERREILYHELTHCTLEEKNHTDEYGYFEDDGVLYYGPKSIMNSLAIHTIQGYGESFLIAHWDYYVTEMFLNHAKFEYGINSTTFLRSQAKGKKYERRKKESKSKRR